MAGETEVPEKTCPTATLSTTNLTESMPPHWEAGYCVIHDMASVSRKQT
jgi:hypothetical protein